MTFGTWRWWVCQPHATTAFTPRKCSWYSFSLGAESTPRPWYRREEYVTEKSSDITSTLSRDSPTVAQPLNHYATPGPSSCPSNYNFFKENTAAKLSLSRANICSIWRQHSGVRVAVRMRNVGRTAGRLTAPSHSQKYPSIMAHFGCMRH